MARKWVLGLALLFLANSAWLAAFSTPSLYFVLNVLFHVAGGLVFVGLLVWTLVRDRQFALASVALVAAALGLYLAKFGATRPHQAVLLAHIVLAAQVMLLLAWHWRSRIYTAALVMACAFPLAMAAYRAVYPNPWDRIRNTPAPVSMDGEGDGPNGLFFPSSAKTVSGKHIPSDFFMDSESCKECHDDIYQQWDGSVHHFGSFNNQFYRKSVEYMQEVAGVKPSKWCAGCHDHALLFSGMFDRPIAETVNTREAQAGLGCMSCHSIVQVEHTMGQGAFRIEYPALHRMATSKNEWIRRVARFVTFAAPKAHRRSFLKPFMRQDSAEFCSTCHKVHLDVAVNSYRWIRGFNDYDAWQASGVSGQGARSFYYPAKPSTCVDCHMPLVPSTDFGSHRGYVHSHRFPAANTAVAVANKDQAQLKAQVDLLTSGFLTVDIFGVVREEGSAGGEVRARGEATPRLSTTFAVGEEAMTAGGVVREAAPVWGPLDRVKPVVRAGDSVRVEVVVRTRKIGHFFPAGTVDAFDVWVELEAQDSSGRTIFHSGYVEDGGRGPVERGAHFYRSFLLDANGNPINKRNAFAARSLLYARLIPPGAADTVHYRLKIPRDISGEIRLKAKVNYRKFAWFYTNFAFAGVSGAGDFSKHFDNRPVSFRPGVDIPDVPIVVVAQATATLAVGPQASAGSAPVKDDRERWNDYGIGLLLQGDLKAAEAAFRRVTELDPAYADGWLNVARSLIQEGETEAARPWIEKALAISPRLARAHFFKALALKAAGEYDAALEELEIVLRQYPRDRVALNQSGRILFLKREFERAVAALRQTLEVDPEDLQAHYNLMLAHRGAGNEELAAHHEKLYLRFKADESAQVITGDYRRIHPLDNNERQMIHEHGGGF